MTQTTEPGSVINQNIPNISDNSSCPESFDEDDQSSLQNFNYVLASLAS